MSATQVVPAHLAFLAIYNPSLGPTDDTFRDQIVFYYSRAARDRRRGRHGVSSFDAEAERGAESEAREEENEKLRQIGLAQGIIGFAGGFADGEPVDHVETEKSRIVMKEIEHGWWMLASINLTMLPALVEPASQRVTSPGADAPPAFEYSSREVSAPALLIQQLLRAHRIFRLHQGHSLSVLYAKLQRERFCSTLERYWTRFANSWDVLLHGNPAADIYHGLKLSAGGELGIGVGEEEWGSGEREVFEDFAGRTAGLVDMVVSRFGDPSPDQAYPTKLSETGKKTGPAALDTQEPWLGACIDPGPSDGVVFSGTGAVTRSSLCDIADWMQQIYLYGEHAYGVRDHPNVDRRRRRRKDVSNGFAKASHGQAQDSEEGNTVSSATRRTTTREYPTIPPPIVSAVERSLDKASAAAEAELKADETTELRSPSSQPGDTWTKYLSLGYGTSWGPGSSKRPDNPRRTSDLLVETHRHSNSPPRQRPSRQQRSGSEAQPMMQTIAPEPEGRRLEDRVRAQVHAENAGYFVIGLKGSLDDDSDAYDDESGEGTGEWNSRTLLRTLHVGVNGPLPPSITTSNDSVSLAPDGQGRTGKLTRLRVVVYVHRPFIYAFLFDQRTETLSMAAFYRNLHTFFAPLHKPLSNSTDPAKIAARIAAASSSAPATTGPSTAATDQQPIYDLVFDPENLTVHTSIPNIPEPGTLSAEGFAGAAASPGWTRVEAINVHSQILTTVAETRSASAADQLERTAKTSRGWWVVWMRVFAGHVSSANPRGQSSPSQDLHLTSLQEGPEATQAVQSAPDDLSIEPVKSATMSQFSAVTASDASDIQATDYVGKEEDTPPAVSVAQTPTSTREAILIRHARDAAAAASNTKSATRSASGMWATMGLGPSNTSARTGGQQAGWGPARLAEGIGVDARRYVEGLLSLNR